MAQLHLQQMLLPASLPLPEGPCIVPSGARFCARGKGGFAQNFGALSSTQMPFGCRIAGALSLEEVPPNASRRKRDPLWRGGFSLGVDLGTSRTGLAISRGFSIRPLTVLELKGQKLELQLLEIAKQEEADEFIIGLPKSFDGKETPQSNKVRSVAGRFAVQAAERGWRVYLQDEHGTSTEATNYMIDMGLKKSARRAKLDAYAAMMVLNRYFSSWGQGTELVVPKQAGLQGKIQSSPPADIDLLSDQ